MRSAAASDSKVGTSPAHASTTSGSSSFDSVEAQSHTPTPRGAVRHGLVDAEVVQCRLFARDNHIDVLATPQAVVGHRKKAVCVRRKVDAYYRASC